MAGLLRRGFAASLKIPAKNEVGNHIRFLSTTWLPRDSKVGASAQPSSPEAASLEVQDYFGVGKFFSVKDLFEARVHLGHRATALDPRMRQFVVGTRFDQCIIDLDQTSLLFRQALNFTAHIAYRGGIILFVTRQPQAVHMVDTTAKECGEYSFTQRWKSEIFCAPSLLFKQEIRLPELVIFLHTRDSHQYIEHRAIVDSAKVGIPTIGIVDTDCNPNIITYPVPGNDDSLCATAFYLDMFKKAIEVGKQRRKEELL